MAQYVGGSTAVQLQTMPYDPVSFKRMRIPCAENHLRIYRDAQGQTLFELRCLDTPVMAFLFHNLRSWELTQKKDAFYRLFRHETGSNVITFFPLNVCAVTTVPSYPMWRIDSAFGEDQFWANTELLIDVIPTDTHCCVVEIRSAERNCVATFAISGMDSDDETVLDAVIRLRCKLRLSAPARIEVIWEHQKLIWFVPIIKSMY